MRSTAESPIKGAKVLPFATSPQATRVVGPLCGIRWIRLLMGLGFGDWVFAIRRDTTVLDARQHLDKASLARTLVLGRLLVWNE